ncbi:hypothetical protein K7X08_001979 [Anisodus acutangulus]|uniref:Uncharacterized protein n=1 Tax=Anisodus acutangulus TaxID=402998 RepID=A0A9Q1LSL5_9SOLA|nr:hypothetical protein K7X08_001979 [Anisodus acutangulus]
MQHNFQAKGVRIRNPGSASDKDYNVKISNVEKLQKIPTEATIKRSITEGDCIAAAYCRTMELLSCIDGTIPLAEPG